MTILLAGDIGGTKTHLGIFSREKGLRLPLAEADFVSAKFPDLTTIVREFLDRVNIPIDAACFGVAGPVVEGVARVTNLPWIIDEKELCQELKFSSIRLLNDLEAIACAVPLLESADLCTLNEGRPVSGGNMAIIAPGTGLGEAFITWDGVRYREHASEGGHVDFAPNGTLQRELMSYLQERLGHVSYESVCSGSGILNIYYFLRERCYSEEPSWLSDKLAEEGKDPVAVIVGAALNHENTCDLCVITLNLFASILGAEAGNMALKVLATNGVYIGGGIPRRILPFLENGQFMRSFRNKGRMTDVVSRVPVFVILNTKVALIGVAWHGFQYRLNFNST